MLILLSTLVSSAGNARPTTFEIIADTSHALFVQNAGQWNMDAHFQMWGTDSIVWLTERSIWLSFIHTSEQTRLTNEIDNPHIIKSIRQHQQGLIYQEQNIRFRFLNINPDTHLVPITPSKTIVSYLVGKNPKIWRTNVQTWKQVRYENIYPGIDLEIKSNGSDLVLDFYCKSDCNNGLPRVRWELQGANQVKAYPINNRNLAGVIRLPTINGYFNIFIRYRGHSCKTLYSVFQHGDIGGIIQGDPNRNIPTHLTKWLPLSSHQTSTALYSTFIGAGQKEYGTAITADKHGDVYVGGFTFSADFPTTPGVVDRTFKGKREAFLAKLNAAGSELDFATFLGGNGDDWVQEIWVDSEGYIYLAGFTTSDDFPVTPGAYDVTFNDGIDIFVSKLSPEGNLFIYSTYIGGSLTEYVPAMKVDAVGRVYLAGHTYSNDFPTTTEAYDRTPGGYITDAFVLRLSPQGNRLEYSTLLGGSNGEWAHDLVIDELGNAYIVGYTASDDFPTTPDAVQDSYSGEGDVFLAEIDSSGSNLLYGTYLGGEDKDWGKGLALRLGYLYLLGYSTGTVPEITEGYDVHHHGGWDAFLIRFRVSDKRLLTGTYLGGSADENLRGHLVVEDGGVYVAGETASHDFPVTTDAFSHFYNGGVSDAFVAVFSVDLHKLRYGTYIGGEGEDRVYSYKLTPSGRFCMSGSTNSPDYPVSQGAYDTTFNGDVDAFVTCLSVSWGTPPSPTPTITPTPTPTPTPPVYPDAYEPDNTCSTAKWLYPGSSQRHNFHQSGDEDWAKFKAKSGNIYILETQDLESLADTIMDLYGPDCTTVLMSDDDGGPGFGSRIEWSPLADGIYKVRIHPCCDTTGPNTGYTLTLTEITPTPTPVPSPQPRTILVPMITKSTYLHFCDPYEPNDSRFAPWGPIQLETEYRAYLCRGDEEDNYFFEISRTRTVEVHVIWPSVFIGHASIWIYNANNLDQNAYLCNEAPISDRQTILSCSLPEQGRYIIRMYADNPKNIYDNERSYIFRVVLP